MAGDRFRLEVKERARLGSPESRRLRKQGFVPGVLYGKTTAQAFAVAERELRSALTGPSGLHAVLDVVLEGQSEMHPSILKEYQRDPIRGHVRHIDLQEVRLDVAIQATVQVHLHGAEDAPGVKEGGVVEHHLWDLQVECLPTDVPTHIDADITKLGINESLKVADLKAPDKCTIPTSRDEVVVSVVPPQVLRVEEAEEAAAEAVEGEEAEAGAEGAAGEEAAEGES